MLLRMIECINLASLPPEKKNFPSTFKISPDEIVYLQLEVQL